MSDQNFQAAVSPTTPQPQRSVSYQDIYSNNIRAGFTVTDMRLIFGCVKDKEVGTPFIEDYACVYFSPQQFKFLTELCQVILANFEKNFGRINSPPGYVVDRNAFVKAFEAYRNALVPSQPKTP